MIPYMGLMMKIPSMVGLVKTLCLAVEEMTHSMVKRELTPWTVEMVMIF